MPLWNIFRSQGRNTQARQRARLRVERLEDRSVPSTTPGSVSGEVFLAANSDPALAGVPVTLSGTTDQGTSFNVSTATDIHGNFDFVTVPTGSYSLSAGPV